VFNFYKVRSGFSSLRADADPVADIRFMPFWTKYFWQERLKKRAKMWSCLDWRLWRSWSDIWSLICLLCVLLSSLALILWFTFLISPDSVTSTLFNGRVLTYVHRSRRADANDPCIARSQIHFLLTCILYSNLYPRSGFGLGTNPPAMGTILKCPSRSCGPPPRTTPSTTLDVADAKSRIGDPEH
jgi:hypothetical protein